MVQPNVANLQLRVTTKGRESFAQIDRSMDTTATKAAATTKRFGGIGGLNSAISGLIPLAGTLAGPLAIGSVVTGLTRMGSTAITAGTEIGKLARNVGLPTELIGSLAVAAQNAGTDIGEVEGAIFSFNTALGEARIGDPAALKAFENLGVAVRDLAGEARPAEEVLADMFDALQNLDSADRAERGMLILGESAARLSGVFDQGSDALTDYVDIFDEDFVKAASTFTRTSKDIRNGFTRLQNQLTATALPALDDVAMAFEGIVNNDDHDWSGLFTVLEGFFTGLGNFFVIANTNSVTFLTTLGNIVVGIKDLIVNNSTIRSWVGTIRTLFNNAKTIVGGVVDEIKGIVTAVTGLVRSNSTIRTWAAAARSIFDGVVTGIRVVTTVVGEIIAGFRDLAVDSYLEQWNGVVVPIFNTVKGAVQGVVTAIGGFISNIVTLVRNNETLQAWAGTANTIFGTVRDVIAGVATTVGGAVNAFLRFAGRDEINFDDLISSFKTISVDATATKDALNEVPTGITNVCSNGQSIAKTIAGAATQAEKFTGFLEDGTLEIEGQITAIGDLRSEHFRLLNDVDREEALKRVAQQTRETKRLEAIRLFHMAEEEGFRSLEALEKQQATDRQTRLDDYAEEVAGIREEEERLRGLVASGVDPEELTPAVEALQERADNLETTFGGLKGETDSVKDSVDDLAEAVDKVSARTGLLRDIFGTTAEARDSVASAIKGLITGAQSFGQAVQGLIDGVLDRLLNKFADLAAISIFNLLGVGDGTGGLADAIRGGSGGGGGNPVNAGIQAGVATAASAGINALINLIRRIAGLPPLGEEGDGEPRTLPPLSGGTDPTTTQPVVTTPIGAPESDTSLSLDSLSPELRSVVDLALANGGTLPGDIFSQSDFDILERLRELEEERDGGGFGFNSLQPNAEGGIIRRPTAALIGEAGPEAIVPLSGGRTIPVEIRGGGAGQTITINIVQNFEGSIGEDETSEAARAAAAEVQKAFLPGGLAFATV